MAPDLPKPIRWILLPVAGIIGGLLLAACSAGAGTDELEGSSTEIDREVVNCGREVALDGPPERVVALNSAAVENLLALGLGDRIVAAVGERAEIKAEWREEFSQLNVLDAGADFYPSAEAILDTEPDFVYSVYPSAFHKDDGIMTREDLAALDIETYLSPGRCPDRDMTQALEFEDLWAELRDLSELLGVPDRAEKLIAQQGAALEEARSSMPKIDHAPTVFWWDMGTDQPTAGVCCGGPGMLLRALGLKNIFDDVEGSWAEVSWEAVIERDPDLVVMVDTSEGWEQKHDYIAADHTLSQLRAFANNRVVELPFAQTTPGLQSIDGIQSISKALTQLELDQ